MPHFTASRRIPFRADQVFNVISDVAKYREFLPLVERSTVRGRRAAEPNGDEQFNADLVVAYHPLRIEEHFASEVSTSVQDLTVRTQSTGQALKKLTSEWQVKPVGENGCEVTFTLDYELKNFFLQKILGGMFDQAVRKVMNAFEDRVRTVYAS